MSDIVITEFMDQTAVDVLAREFDITYAPDLVDRRDDLLKMIAGTRGLIVRNRTIIDSQVISATERLQVVGRLGVGLDNIDLDACRDHSIEVIPATGANADAVAEYVIAASLMLTRGIFLSTDRVASGEWPRTEMSGLEIAGRTMGLIGLGDIARRVATRAQALGMKVQAHDPYVDSSNNAWGHVASVSLPDLLAKSDVVSVHVPLTSQTRGLIDSVALSTMRINAVLINTSRGGVIVDDALVDALRDGAIRGAALDVFEHEPVDEVHGSRFSGVPNLILTPHVAGVTDESNRRVSHMIATAVGTKLRGTAS